MENSDSRLLQRSAPGAGDQAQALAHMPPNETRMGGTDSLSVGMAGLLLWWILACTAVLAAGSAFLSWHFKSTVAVKASGTIVPGLRRRIKTPLGAIVQRVYVVQGQRVSAGDTLAQLDARTHRADLEDTIEQLRMNRARMEALRADIRGRTGILTRERQQRQVELDRAWLGVERLRAEDEAERRAPGVSGWQRLPFAQRVPVRQMLLEVRRCSLELALADQRLANLRDQRMELLALRQQRVQFHRDSSRAAEVLVLTTIVSPVAGTVLTDRVEARSGDQLRAGEVLLELAPLDSWQADMLISEQDRARVRPGQRARLFIAAFPHLEYKIFRAHVGSVSLESVGDGRYRARLDIDDPTVVARGRSYSLAYGMHADAQIVVDQGRILDLVWRHLLRRIGKASRHGIYAAAGTEGA